MDSGRKILELALSKGLLRPEQLDEIRKAIEGERFERTPGSSTPKSKSIAAEKLAELKSGSDAESEPTFGRFHKLEFVGQGGMALVYKAFDPDLGRNVALKFLRVENPELIYRLLTEARAQARIEHPNVCRVYEVGQADGKTYIAMQYVAGSPVRDVIPELSLEQKLNLMKQVAEAIHAAHRIGLIHRDIKPANIMVERNSEGEYVPYVLDFGLAREVQAPGLTATGLVVGSPFYMSPEQARGEVHKLDRRSDVYSLGTTLYQILSERLPFEANTSVDVLVAIMHDEPFPLRQRDTTIPRDVETIVMKCLEKEPQRRYDSAKALAEDLGRYLDGEPIAARPISLLTRYYKRARKHKMLVVSMSLAALLLMISGGIAVYSRITAKRQAELASQLGQQVKELEAISRYSSLMPLHDVRPERQMIRKRMQQIQEQMRRIGKLGDGPGFYALGQGYLALREFDQAQDSLTRAWKSDYTRPEVAYALGQVMASRYQKALDHVQQLDNEELRKLRTKEVEQEFRTPALQYLEASKTVELASPEYLSGLIAFLDRRYEEGLFHAKNAAQQIPWLYEASKLRGDILVTRAEEKQSIGNYEDARKDYEDAAAMYQNALQMAHSDTELRDAECGRLINLMDLDDLQGKSPAQDFQAAVHACDQTLVADPENEDALEKKSYAYWKWGSVQNDAYGKDPRETLQQAIQIANIALKQNPKSKNALNRIGSACFAWGHYAVMHGEDPLPWLHRSVESFEKALAVDPQFPDVLLNMGIAYGMTANYEMSQGKDPNVTLDKSIASFRKAIARNPDFLGAYHDLSLAHLIKGEWQNGKGLDPRESLQIAISNSQKVIQLNPGYVIAYSDRGEALRDLGAYEMDHGQDPRASLNEAIDNMKTTVRLRPNFSYAYEYISRAYQIRAQYEMMIGIDPNPSLDFGADWARQAIARNAAFPEAHGSLGIIRRLEAEHLLNQGKNPNTKIQEARLAFGEAKRINSEIYWLYTEMSRSEVLAARWAMRDRTSPASYFTRSDEFIQRALQLDPSSDSTFEAAGEHALWKAQSLRSNCDQAQTVINKGLADLQKATSINSQYARLDALKASLLLEMAHCGSNTVERTESARRSVALFQNALTRNPNLNLEFKSRLAEAEALSK